MDLTALSDNLKMFTTQFNEEKEEYILTKDEEETVILHNLGARKGHLRWKMQFAGMQEGDIVLKLSQTDWSVFDVALTQKLLQNANSRKHYDLWQKEQRVKEKQEELAKIQELKDTWNAKKVYGLMAWTSQYECGKKLIVHDDNRHLIKSVCYFLADDERFETELGYSFRKGLMLRGTPGLGKTHILKCVEKNGLHPFKIVSMIEIADEIKQEGEYNMPGGNVYIDDVGSEEPVINHYGTKINFFKSFLEDYYLRNTQYRRLMISTNSGFNEIEEKYGFRVRSRIKDMFNIIDVKGKDMRG